MKQPPKRRPCELYQVNRRAPDFTCDLPAGHTEAHRDPRTGLRWRPRGLPGWLKRKS